MNCRIISQRKSSIAAAHSFKSMVTTSLKQQQHIKKKAIPLWCLARYRITQEIHLGCVCEGQTELKEAPQETLVAPGSSRRHFEDGNVWECLLNGFAHCSENNAALWTELRLGFPWALSMTLLAMWDSHKSCYLQQCESLYIPMYFAEVHW